MSHENKESFEPVEAMASEINLKLKDLLSDLRNLRDRYAEQGIDYDEEERLYKAAREGMTQEDRQMLIDFMDDLDNHTPIGQ